MDVRFVPPILSDPPDSILLLERKDVEMKTCHICKTEKKFTREMSFGTVCSQCYLENYAS